MKHFAPPRRRLPSLDTLMIAFAAFYALDTVGLCAALWLNDPDSALRFVLGMAGAGIAMIATAVVQGRL